MTSTKSSHQGVNAQIQKGLQKDEANKTRDLPFFFCCCWLFGSSFSTLHSLFVLHRRAHIHIVGACVRAWVSGCVCVIECVCVSVCGATEHAFQLVQVLFCFFRAGSVREEFSADAKGKGTATPTTTTPTTTTCYIKRKKKRKLVVGRRRKVWSSLALRRRRRRRQRRRRRRTTDI